MKKLRNFVIGFQGYSWISKFPDGEKIKQHVTPLVDVKDEVITDAKDFSKIIMSCIQQIKVKHPNIEDLAVMFILEV